MWNGGRPGWPALVVASRGGPEGRAVERGEYERGERRLLGPPRPPFAGGERQRRWGGPLGPC